MQAAMPSCPSGREKSTTTSTALGGASVPEFPGFVSVPGAALAPDAAKPSSTPGMVSATKAPGLSSQPGAASALEVPVHKPLLDSCAISFAAAGGGSINALVGFLLVG